MTEQETMRMIRLQIRAICKHLGCKLERDDNQIGPDECVAVWVLKPICKECGK
jgi:phosphatidylglycerophosphatase A